MACMCGDIQCPSCGPAQGNWRCPICNAWADDCCEHIDEKTGTIKDEFQALANETADRERLADEEWYESIVEAEKYERKLQDEGKI